MSATVTNLPQPADTPRQRSPRTIDAARPAVASLQQQGTYSFSARNAPFARARNTSEIVASPDLQSHRIASREAGRATYIPRPALAAAICVSWTIALVAGVVLAMEILR